VKIPRDVHGDDLVKALRVLGYQFDRQDGSHMRLSTRLNGEHHVTIPKHKPLKTARWSKACLNQWLRITN
jgi:predicted RNA binding protein YcfA (HicA-like mRNA interferase family)